MPNQFRETSKEALAFNRAANLLADVGGSAEIGAAGEGREGKIRFVYGPEGYGNLPKKDYPELVISIAVPRHVRRAVLGTPNVGDEVAEQRVSSLLEEKIGEYNRRGTPFGMGEVDISYIVFHPNDIETAPPLVLLQIHDPLSTVVDTSALPIRLSDYASELRALSTALLAKNQSHVATNLDTYIRRYALDVMHASR